MTERPTLADILDSDELAALLAQCEWCGDTGCEKHDPDTGLSPLEMRERAEEHAQDRRDEKWGSIDG